MKLLLRSALSLLLLCTVSSLSAQRTLTNSRTSGSYTYIYKLTDQETFEIASKSTTVVNDGFLHTLVDSFYNVKSNIYPKKLPFGNYLKVKAVFNKLQYTLDAVSNVNISFINNTQDFQISVSDLKGNLVEDAIVKVGKRKRLKYNADSRLYIASSGADPQVISVNYNGINSFFTYDQEERYKPVKVSALNKLIKPKQRQKNSSSYKPEVPKYNGFIAFNKPIYKPLDTVKFKTYILTNKGKAVVNKELRVELDRSGAGQSNIFLTMLKPYFEGGYEYSFALHDSLNLRLDRTYGVLLKEKVKNEWKEVHRNYFRYEDYELKSLDFSVRTDKDEYSIGTPVTIYMKAVDENQLAVPDGRVEVLVRNSHASKFHHSRVFVKDLLWKTNITLDPVGETKLVLPDSIFPKADLSFNIDFTFLNSNNEKRTAHRYLRYVHAEKAITTKLKQDSLYINYLVNGQVSKQSAMLYASHEDSDVIDSVRIELPHVMKVDYNKSEYEIKTADGFIDYIEIENLQAAISVQAAQNKDSLLIMVANPNKIPFWYTIFSGKKVFLRGYATQLDTLLKHTSAKPSEVKISYRLGAQLRTAATSASYTPNLLSVKLLAPGVVYPGQTVNMQVAVSDADGKPVPQTDVTAFAVTSKFKTSNSIALPYFGKYAITREQKPQIDIEDIRITSEMKLNWDKWAKALKLDTIEYYKFMNTPDMYVNVESGNDTSSASVVPFVMNNGDIEPVLIAYIDDVPVYFNEAQQYRHYAFSLRPGRHYIKLRTAKHVVGFNYDFVKGKRTVISLAADLKNPKATVAEVSAEMTEQESALLAQYMIRIENNFGLKKTTLNTQYTSTLLQLPQLNANYLRMGQNSIQGSGGTLYGPFPELFLYFKSGNIEQEFLKEPGYTYTFLPGLLKQKSFPRTYVFNTSLNNAVADNKNYRQHPVKSTEIDSIWNEYLNLRSSITTSLNNNRSGYGSGYGRVTMKADTSMTKKLPYIKNIFIIKEGEPDFLNIYPGNTSDFGWLEKGHYRAIYLFRDNQYFITNYEEIKDGGQNYFEWKQLKVQTADSLSTGVDAEMKSLNLAVGYFLPDVKLRISKLINRKFFGPEVLTVSTFGRVLSAKTKKPLVGAMVTVKGLNSGVLTNKNGRFELKTPGRGSLIFSFKGYEDVEILAAAGEMGDVFLEDATQTLKEIGVVGYAPQSKMLTTGSVTIRGNDIQGSPAGNVMDLLQGRVAGLNIQENTGVPGVRGSVNIRGLSEVVVSGVSGQNGNAAGMKPLIIVDGLPYSGDLSSIDQSEIENITVMKDVEATAIYGASAAGGVIIVKTRGGKMQSNAAGELVQQHQQTLRSNFSDYAFWQPKLLTDAEGKASFTVKFPDDITSWNTNLIAINGRKQSGRTQSTIKSFKILSANFVSPLFAIDGDSIDVIGKLMNYSSTEETSVRKLKYNGVELLNSTVKFKNAHIDTTPVVAKYRGNQNTADTLAFEYTMSQSNGYFDGELRKVPVLQAGVMETKGYFNALTADTSLTYKFDKNLGKVTLRAEASVFPTLLDEMEKLRNYEYLCNEQLASKLKALLLEKKVRAYLDEEFKEEKNIKSILEKLQKNKLPEGTWGWWQRSQEELWISLHVVEALLLAEKQGYAVVMDKHLLYTYLLNKMSDRKHFDQIYGVRLLLLLNDKHFANDWIEAIEKERKELAEINLAARKKKLTTYEYKQPLYEKLQLMQLRQQVGMPVDLKWLVEQKKETMFGNAYWGDESRRFWDNSIQNTLLAYQILKREGKHRSDLDAITRYFLEQRKDGQWRNTFESSLILETILPELIAGNKKAEPASISLNSAENITVFPFNKVIEPENLTLSKKGNAPVYFTAYQQFNNPKPDKVSKDFTVKTTLTQNGTVVKNLKAGTLTTLNVEVEVRADADYVMIEIPIPAGCSYENKIQSFWGVETHREYFKHKTSIFCSKLKSGKYNFSIQLLPRYSGNYVLNPAKAEMMYFPVFYGREEMKRVGIN